VRFFCLIGQKRAAVPNEEKPGLFYLRLSHLAVVLYFTKLSQSVENKQRVKERENQEQNTQKQKQKQKQKNKKTKKQKNKKTKKQKQKQKKQKQKNKNKNKNVLHCKTSFVGAPNQSVCRRQ
jgi:outer membrane biosynthesis protein TonB